MTDDLARVAWASQHVGQPVILGLRDCGTLVREFIEGPDHPIPWLVAWDRPMSAGRELLRFGPGGFHDWFVTGLGWSPHPATMARDGDVLVLSRSHAAPVVGPHALIAVHQDTVTLEHAARLALDVPDAVAYRAEPSDG